MNKKKNKYQCKVKATTSDDKVLNLTLNITAKNPDEVCGFIYKQIREQYNVSGKENISILRIREMK